MSAGLPLSEVGALVGDPGRANILSALIDGRALTACELAWTAGVTPATASGHLTKLVAGGLLAVASARGGTATSASPPPTSPACWRGMMVVAPAHAARRAAPRATPRTPPCARPAPATTTSPGASASPSPMRSSREAIELADEAGAVTEGGGALRGRFGVRARAAPDAPPSAGPASTGASAGRTSPACSGGALPPLRGLGWIRRERDSRAVTVTPEGRRGFADTFGLSLN